LLNQIDLQNEQDLDLIQILVQTLLKRRNVFCFVIIMDSISSPLFLDLQQTKSKL